MSERDDTKKFFNTDTLKSDLSKANEKSEVRNQKFQDALNDPSNPLSKWWVRLIIAVVVIGLLKVLFAFFIK